MDRRGVKPPRSSCSKEGQVRFDRRLGGVARFFVLAFLARVFLTRVFLLGSGAGTGRAVRVLVWLVFFLMEVHVPSLEATVGHGVGIAIGVRKTAGIAVGGGPGQVRRSRMTERAQTGRDQGRACGGMALVRVTLVRSSSRRPRTSQRTARAPRSSGPQPSGS